MPSRLGAAQILLPQAGATITLLADDGGIALRCRIRLLRGWQPKKSLAAKASCFIPRSTNLLPAFWKAAQSPCGSPLCGRLRIMAGGIGPGPAAPHQDPRRQHLQGPPAPAMG